MTNLNQKLRDEIIESVINKGTTIPARKVALKKATELRVRELCLERVPKEFGLATKTLPAEWFPLSAGEGVPYEMCPITLATMTDFEIHRHSWQRFTVPFEPFRHPINTKFHRSTYMDQGQENIDGVMVKKPEDLESWEARMADLIKEGKQIRADEEKARTELRQFLYSVKTYKQVLEKMPELEPHLPNYTKPMPLTVPVAPILRTLGALGFDKSKECA